jgi:predicted Rossmann fold nucleotide-binding protein DprA/Smf involved in DNA uptake
LAEEKESERLHRELELLHRRIGRKLKQTRQQDLQALWDEAEELRQRLEEMRREEAKPNPRGRRVDPDSLRSRIVALLDEHSEYEWTAEAVAEKLKGKLQTVRTLLSALAREDRIERTGQGTYASRK